jgi:predicted HD phosphohydrolase
MVETVRYRVGQFLRALTARVPDDEVEQAMRVLTPEAQGLFRRQAMQDQRHALAVCRTLYQAGHTDPELLAAALLHDVGKAAAQLPAWQRAIIVLLDRFAPRLLARLSQREPKAHVLSRLGSWRYAFAVHARHPEAGARWAQETGCSPLTVALIRRHQDRLTSCEIKEDQLLTALQAADSLN